MSNYKDKYADKIAEQFYKLEDRICADIVRRIKKTGEITSTADYQIGILTNYDYSSADIEDMIKDATKKSYPEIFKLYDEVVDWEYVRNKTIYEQINAKYIPYEENITLQNLTKSLKKQTQEAFENYTGTMGVVTRVNGQYTFLPLTSYYQKTLNSAVLDISSGAFDYNSVLKRTVKELSNSGIRVIDYASGYTSRIAVATRRAVMTGVSQLTGHISEMNAEQLGTDYFEIDYHSGARPTHRPWQGKVWSKEELVSVCGLGTVTGLKGANCYHEYYPFIKGVSERNYTDEELERLNALEDIKREYKGKEYDAYHARQRQRELETAMRAQRAKIKGLERGGADEMDIVIEKARYQGQLAEYRAFSEAMELKTHMERVYIDGLGRVVTGKIDAAKAMAKTEAEKLLIKARKAEKDTTKALTKAVENTSAWLEGLEYRFKSADSLIRKLKTKSKQKGMPVSEYAKKVTDVLRYTVVSESGTFAEDYHTIIHFLQKKCYNQVEVVNTLKDDTAVYRGINTLMETPDGYVFELQYHTPESLKIKEINHKLYEEQRLETTTEERKQELKDLMLVNSNKIKTPKNIDSITNIKRKE